MSQLSNRQFRRGPGLLRLALAVALAVAMAAPTAVQADETEASWKSMREGLFGARPILDGAGVLGLEAPIRASDAALVPVEITDRDPGRIKTLTLIVDENPVPVAAEIALAPESKLRVLEARLRVNAYSFVRVIAETADGSLYMVKRYVKASGGCSAPASKNTDEAIAAMGQMRLRRFPAAGPDGQESDVQLQIRHPNLTGMQMDQLTGHYRPAHFVQAISISADGTPVLSLKGGFSLSENPTLRFKFLARGAKWIAAHVEDTEGKIFEQRWEIAAKAEKDS